MVSSGGGTIGGEHRAGGGRHGGARAGLSEVGPGGQGDQEISRREGWRHGLQAVTGVLASTFFMGIQLQMFSNITFPSIFL